MKQLDFSKSFMEGGYTTPSVEVCDIVAEKGFVVSQNPDLTYGGAGEAGAIGDGNSYEL